MLGNLIGGFITILIGTSLMPAVANSIFSGLNNVNATTGFIGPNNVSGAGATVVSLVTLFYALGLMSAGVALAVGGLKQAGIM